MNMSQPSHPLARHHRAPGFTLIELMITVAIVAILAALAYPSYRNYVLRGQLVNATNGLAALRANMERYFQDNRTYASTGAFVTPCATATTIGTFTLTCTTAPGATTFQAQAVGSGITNGFTFFVNQLNTQWTTVTGVSNWYSCPTAWVVKEGMC